MPPRPAVVLLSGGVDSSTVLAMVRRDGFDVHALSMRYGQRHLAELEAAALVARRLGVDYGLTLSCYDPAPAGACGRCDACALRLKGFAEAGLRDPAPYR